MSSEKSVRVLILITWAADKEWPFVDALCAEELDCDVIGANFPDGYNTVFDKILRFWPRYLFSGIKAFIRRKDYDVILPWQQVSGLVFGFLKRLFRSRYPKLIILKFVYPARRNPVIAGIRKFFVKFALGAADALWCVSNEEIDIRTEMFGYPKEKASFVPIIPTNISDAGETHDLNRPDGDYVLSVGVERDYRLLVDVFREVDFRLKIVTRPYNVKGIELPGNVEVIHAYGRKVMDLYRDARFIVVPMKDPNRPGGESVTLESFAYGKAIVITRTVASVDYVKPMENGILVEPDDPVSLRDAVLYLLDHPEHAEDMGKKNRQLYLDFYSSRATARRVKEGILDVLGKSEA